ncbi:hypothetical protein CAP35_11930 [Chitinophagaceae bacterium IBVUCB1]|nr:hypothetical protein CAP35_11930 [Chitinophagaceae bacterium IBVUCB1]
MSSANDIIQELRELNSTLVDAPRTMPYEVPAGYFDALAGMVVNAVKIDIQQEPVLHLPIVMPYEVPDGYFEHLAANVLATINEPVLSQIKEPTYIVPEGYFDNLPEMMIAKAREAEAPKQTKAIQLPVWKTIRWAAAAILLLGVGFGLFRYLGNVPTATPQAQLAMLPKDSISQYVEMHIDEFEMDAIAATLEAGDVGALTEKLSEKEIEDYLNENDWDETTMNL